MDKTIILREILSKTNSQLLFGEMQYAFISFVMGENLESFE